jgi:hypothetical protein
MDSAFQPDAPPGRHGMTILHPDQDRLAGRGAPGARPELRA